jgi:RNA polymerase sigma-70 factor (ECF subfamily)
VRRFQQDESRGRFRTWLYAIGKNICLQQLEKVAKDRARQATSLDPAELAHKPSGEAILVEHRRRAFEWAADRIRDDFQERTWQAFWRTSVEGQPIESVAAELRLSVGAVYIARCRVMRRLRTEVQLITDDDGLENRSSGTQHSQPDVGKMDRMQRVEKLQVAKKEPGK